jgi:ketosteroid isomerase-like protein
MPSSETKQLIRKAFAALTDFQNAAEDVAGFFSDDYVQIVDGKQLDRRGFVEHVLALRSHLSSLEIDIERIVADDVSAATVHLVTATRRTGETSTIKVVAFYEIRDGKIALIDELSRVVHGSEEDHELGSIQG